MKKELLLLVLVASIAVTVAQPSVILVNSSFLAPEGIEWHPTRNQFIISSTGFGTVNLVSDSAVLTPLVQDSRLSASVGLQIDAAHNRLYICNANFTAIFGGITTGFLSSLIVADLQNGTILWDTDLSHLGSPSSGHFANDVVNDESGNIYVTDSGGAAIWKLTPNGTASVLVTDPRWVETNSALNYIGLNGIEYRPGYLITGKYVGEIYKVSSLGTTPVVTKVQLDRNLTNAGFDGMIFAADGTLILVGGLIQKVWRLRSTDNWVSATFLEEGDSAYPAVTTATLRGTDVYVVHGHFGVTTSIYEIEKITLHALGTTGAASASTSAALTTGPPLATTGHATTGSNLSGDLREPSSAHSLSATVAIAIIAAVQMM